MKLLLWDPLQGMIAMSNRLTRGVTDPYAPTVQIFEMQYHLGIRAEAPDFQSDDVLTQHSEHEQDTDFEDENGHRTEGAYGEFTWSFSLPPKSVSTKPKGIGIKAE